MRPHDLGKQPFVASDDSAGLLGEIIKSLEIVDEARDHIVDGGRTALPMISAASAICADEVTGSPVPSVMRTLTHPTMCRAMKKKRVGGNTARNSSFTFSTALFIAVTR